MRTTIGLVLALVLGTTGAFAQGGPKGEGHGRGGHGGGRGPGPAAAHIQQGPAHVERQRGPARIDRGARMERREAPRNANQAQRPVRSANERAARVETRRSANANSNANKDMRGSIERSRRAEQVERRGREADRSREADRARQADRGGEADRRRDADRTRSSQGAASGESGRSERETGRHDVAGSNRKDVEKRVADARHADLSGDKRNRIVTALRETKDVKHRTDGKFDLRVGRRLPRDWAFLPLPLAVVDIVPEYRDYLFAYVDDDYVICDPDTYEIVAIIPVSGHEYAGYGGHGRCTDRIYLNEDEQDLILHSIRRANRVDVRGLTVGWAVPRDIELLPFPDRVLDRVGELGACRYFVADDQVAVVDPDEDRIVLLIDRA
jgi:hypothetical protein